MEIVEKAPSYLLTTPERVIEALGIESPNLGRIAWQIERATSTIQQYTGRTFARERVIERLTSDGGNILVVSNTPLREVHEISFDGEQVEPADNYRIDNATAGFIWHDIRWLSTRYYHHWLEWRQSRFARKRWFVEYTAGYILPGWDEESDLPAQIEGICIDMVGMWGQAGQSNTNVRSERVGDSQVTWATADEATRSLLVQLDGWKRID